MRRICLTPAPSPFVPARWHDRYDEPCADQAIEVDVGDWSIWTGVRYHPELEAFLDEESGALVSVVMWRYAAPPQASGPFQESLARLAGPAPTIS